MKKMIFRFLAKIGIYPEGSPTKWSYILFAVAIVVNIITYSKSPVFIVIGLLINALWIFGTAGIISLISKKTDSYVKKLVITSLIILALEFPISIFVLKGWNGLAATGLIFFNRWGIFLVLPLAWFYLKRMFMCFFASLFSANLSIQDFEVPETTTRYHLKWNDWNDTWDISETSWTRTRFYSKTNKPALIMYILFILMAIFYLLLIYLLYAYGDTNILVIRGIAEEIRILDDWKRKKFEKQYGQVVDYVE